MNTSLFNISAEYLELIENIEANGGEVTEEQIEALAINKSELNQKSIAYLEVIQDRESFISRIDEEVKRLNALK